MSFSVEQRVGDEACERSSVKEIKCWWRREREGWSHRVERSVRTVATAAAAAEEDAVMEKLFTSRAK